MGNTLKKLLVLGSLFLSSAGWSAFVPGSVQTNNNAGTPSGVGYTTGSSSVPVNVLNTVPVTGTFFQTTQPISGTVNLIQPNVIGATVTYNGTQQVNVGTLYQPSVIGATVTYNGTQQVTVGTLYQPSVIGATVTYNGVQTVTIGNFVTTHTVIQANAFNVVSTFTYVTEVNALDVVSTSTIITGNIPNVSSTNTYVTNPTTSTIIQPNALNVVSTNTLISMPTLTKGTQGATGISTQDLKDAGRTSIVFYVTASTVGATTVESALTLTKSAGTGATSAANFFVITSGKRFRISSISVATQGNVTATTHTTTLSIRLATAGNCATGTTPVLYKFRSSAPATTLFWDRLPTYPIPDGYEVLGDGTLNICASVNSTFTTNAPTVDLMIVGYEY